MSDLNPIDKLKEGYTQGSGDLKYIRLMLRRMLPEYIFDISSMENNPVTLPEVITLLDGVTVGGHRVSDVEMITNLRNTYKFIDDQLVNHTYPYDVILKTIHTLSYACLVDHPSQFRNMKIKVGGTTNYKCIHSDLLLSEFDNTFYRILDIDDLELRALTMFCWLTYSQFFEDCNKRTARMFSNYLMMESRVGIFNISRHLHVEYTSLLLEMFDTANYDNMINFLKSKCILRFDGKDFIE